ncbi:MAG: adenylosuccinate synthase [Armatimonadota bacterium]
MPVTAIVGLQWGDEGKGRLVDVLAQESELVIRFNGGANAGHTVVNELGTFKMHLTPSGIFSPRATAIIGNGVLVDLDVLLDELKPVREAGIDPAQRLIVSPRCHVVMPYHKILDGLLDEAKGKGSIGTTRRGIGPGFADKVSYNGIRLADMARPQCFREKLSTQLAVKNRLIAALGGEPLDLGEVYEEQMGRYEQVVGYVREPFPLVQDALARDAAILLEGAQGALLDTDWAAYPYCTGSSPLASASGAGCGIPPNRINRVIGIAKAYSTRVGNGPLPTELHDEMGDAIRDAGQEYGTTTGRPRRCGWFDAEVVRFTCALNGATEVGLTRLDVLDGIAHLRICTEYRLNGRPMSYVEADAVALAECEPVWEDIAGWGEPTSECRRWEELPAAARAYVERIEQLIERPIKTICVGPERTQMVTRE